MVRFCFFFVFFSTIFFISKNVTDHCFSCIKITLTALKSERQTMTRNCCNQKRRPALETKVEITKITITKSRSLLYMRVNATRMKGFHYVDTD